MSSRETASGWLAGLWPPSNREPLDEHERKRNPGRAQFRGEGLRTSCDQTRSSKSCNCRTRSEQGAQQPAKKGPTGEDKSTKTEDPLVVMSLCPGLKVLSKKVDRQLTRTITGREGEPKPAHRPRTAAEIEAAFAVNISKFPDERCLSARIQYRRATSTIRQSGRLHARQLEAEKTVTALAGTKSKSTSDVERPVAKTRNDVSTNDKHRLLILATPKRKNGAGRKRARDLTFRDQEPDELGLDEEDPLLRRAPKRLRPDHPNAVYKPSTAVPELSPPLSPPVKARKIAKVPNELVSPSSRPVRGVKVARSESNDPAHSPCLADDELSPPLPIKVQRATGVAGHACIGEKGAHCSPRVAGSELTLNPQLPKIRVREASPTLCVPSDTVQLPGFLSPLGAKVGLKRKRSAHEVSEDEAEHKRRSRAPSPETARIDIASTTTTHVKTETEHTETASRECVLPMDGSTIGIIAAWTRAVKSFRDALLPRALIV